jgi:nitroimidazol reductase NimA-like FMN-containing flavoprotein (pyridoxamine 5'-phosphate oxidase superfamily)
MYVQRLSTEECNTTLANARFGRLACSRDNQPYIVPTYFIVQDGQIYAFALPGQKLDWMRENPRVCLEIDDVNGRDHWTSVVVSGRFEELSDNPEYESLRKRALELLQGRPMWWEPGAVTVADRSQTLGFEPVYYRVRIDQLTGLRAVAALQDAPTA